MGTCFIIDGAESGEPKRRHDVTIPLLAYNVAPRKRLCTFFLQDLSKRKHYAGVLQKPMRENFALDAWWYKENENSGTTLAAPRRGLVLRVPHCLDRFYSRYMHIFSSRYGKGRGKEAQNMIEQTEINTDQTTPTSLYYSCFDIEHAFLSIAMDR
jgi:hypothetical protein